MEESLLSFCHLYDIFGNDIALIIIDYVFPEVEEIITGRYCNFSVHTSESIRRDREFVRRFFNLQEVLSPMELFEKQDELEKYIKSNECMRDKRAIELVKEFQGVRTIGLYFEIKKCVKQYPLMPNIYFHKPKINIDKIILSLIKNIIDSKNHDSKKTLEIKFIYREFEKMKPYLE